MTGSNPISIITSRAAPRRSSLRVVTIVTAVLLVLLVVAAVFAVREFREHQRLQAADDDRSDAMNTAQQFAPADGHLQGRPPRRLRVQRQRDADHRAKGEFKQSFPAFEKVYQQGKAVGTGELHAAGIEDIDQDSATVLVIHDRTVKSTFGDQKQYLRWSVQLDKVDGAWKIDEFEDGLRDGVPSTWYDLLGVERDATPEQIRVAWREATDRAEPGTSQFKKYNEAAEVLLDARARAAYDAELAAPEPAAGTPETGRSPRPRAEAGHEPPPSRRHQRHDDRGRRRAPLGRPRWPRPRSPSPSLCVDGRSWSPSAATSGSRTTGTTSRSTPGRRPRPPPSGRCRSCSPTTTASCRPTRRGRCAT